MIEYSFYSKREVILNFFETKKFDNQIKKY